MCKEVDHSRRDFVRLTAGAALATGVVGNFPAQAVQQSAPGEALPRGGPRIGCVSWCFHSLSGGTNPERAIDSIGGLGFDGIELVVQAPQDIAGFWTAATVEATRNRLKKYRLQVAQLALFQPVVEGLTSSRAEERQQSLNRFEASCRLARDLGSPIINIVAPWARELSGPRKYLPRYFEVADARPGDKFHIEIARGFDWDELWERFVESMKACLRRAKAHGLKFTVENHTHTMMPDAAAFLTLWNAIRDPDLGMNLDVGWTALQREYPPVAVYKAHKHLMNVHMRDIDGLMRRFVHVGQGVMDFRAIVQALKAVRFQGFLDLEQDGLPGDMKAACARYLAMMKEYLA